MKFRMTEHDEQVAVIKWVRYAQKLYPALRLLHASANGGLRNVITARRMKSEGVTAGIPDLFLPHAAGGYHGLFIEMKTKGGRVSQTQQWWIDALAEQGYLTAVCYDAPAATLLLTRYVQGCCHNKKALQQALDTVSR